MKETGRAQSEKELAMLKKRNQAKSPVKENVKKFEGRRESPVQETVKKFEGKSESPTPGTSRSKSPSVNNQRPNTLVSPTRSKSPGLSSPLRSKSPRLASPLRSKSPLVNSPTKNQSPTFGSPNRSKSPGIDFYNRNSSPGSDSYNRSRSPGLDTYTRNKSQGTNTINRAKSPLSNSSNRSKSPGMISQSPASSPTKSPGVSKWGKSYNGWTKESPVIAETAYNFESTPDDENLPSVGDQIDISWYFDNIEYVTDTKATETNQAAEDVWPGAESSGNLMQHEQRFRNSLNYNIAAWDDEDYEEQPKIADDFIQRLCDQVRHQVEYLCGMNFIKYEAVSYKVRVAGAEGIFYYVKVNVWQKYCLHLRIFSHKNELKAIPALQAILERAQPDNGNIEFF